MYSCNVCSCLLLAVAFMLANAGHAWNTSFGISPDGPQAVDIGVGCAKSSYPAVVTKGETSPTVPAYRYVLENPLAEFLSVHFAYFNLPPNDFVIVRPTLQSVDENRTLTYLGSVTTGPFFSDELFTTSITIELYSVTNEPMLAINPSPCTGFAIDSYRFIAVDATARGSNKEDICGADNSDEAACFKMFPVVFQRSNAVARLLIRQAGGTVFCTGWLVGCEGHLLTNHHCIASQDQAKDTKFEFQAIGDSCGDKCDRPFGCKGKQRGGTAQLVIANPDLDYALVQLEENLSGEYGFLQLRESGAVAGERIYVPQHPLGYGRRIATKTDQDWGKIESLTQGGCMLNQVAYSLDTQGGSSGSPVISWDDNTVVALHHCGGCPNTAVNTRDIVADLRAKGLLPKCAVV